MCETVEQKVGKGKELIVREKEKVGKGKERNMKP